MNNIPKSAAIFPEPALSMQWILWGLVVPLMIYASRAVEILVQTDIPFDTLHTYLPFAQQFLESPSGFFNNPESFKVAPGAIIYMALAGASPTAVKTANLFISLAALVLVFDAARKIGGRAAAVGAAWLFTLPHMLLQAGISLMAESPFVFFVALWIWATSYAVHAPPGKNAFWWQFGATLLAGIALACATLTRATYIYWLPFSIILFFVASRRLQAAQRGAALRIVLLHLVALALVGSFVARQYSNFGQPTVATGSGAALYFGSNPMLSGYEPPYFGLTYDVVSVTKGLPHLSIEGDQRLMATAKSMLWHTSPAMLVRIYVQKLGAILFFSRAHLERKIINDRAWRVALVLLACLGAWGKRRNLVVWMVTGAAIYQCAVHVPVLYNPRYSIGALDVLLVLLAAQGIDYLWKHPSRKLAFIFAMTSIFSGIALGAYHQRASAPLMPHLHRMNAPLIQKAIPHTLTTQGWSTDPFTSKAQILSGEATLEWFPGPSEMDGFTVLSLRVPYFQGKCKNLVITHSLPGITARSTNVNLEGFAQGQDISWGMESLTSPAYDTGQLKLFFHCTPGTRMQLGELALYDSTLGRIYQPR